MIQNAADRQGLLKIVLEAQVRRFERQYKGDRSSPAYSQGLQALVAAIKGANDMQLQKMATERYFQNGQLRAREAIVQRVENGNPLSAWARDVKKTEEEARKRAKKEQTYVVVQHTNGNGFVVRIAYNGWVPAPYSGAKIVKEFKIESAAQKHADKLNGY